MPGDPRKSELYGELTQLVAELRRDVDARWQRTLPMADYLVDRWEKAKALGFGERASIYDSAVVMGDVSVGEHTWIGPFTVLDGTGGLEIGSYCSVSTGVQIYSHDSVQWALSGGKAEIERAPTHIGSRCSIGPNAIITKGVTIGDGSIIGANSLVLHDVPPGSRALGNPARVTPSQ